MIDRSDYRIYLFLQLKFQFFFYKYGKIRIVYES